MLNYLLQKKAFELDLKLGDIILAGRFKNQREVVKEISTDDLGQLVINGKKALTFRIEKTLPKHKQSRKTRGLK